MKKLFAPTLLGVFFLCLSSFGQTHLVPRGSAWKYLDNGTNQGAVWSSPLFDDSGWAAGNAELGYGDADESTVVGFGADANNKFITTYFRKSITVGNPSDFVGLTLDILRDDGAVVYLNGAEVYRTNLPEGTIGYQTRALSAIVGADESTFLQTSLNTSLLVAGTNIIAVEIHQSSPTSSDISFNLGLIGQTTSPAAAIARAPYLQMGTPTAVTVRWRTDVATNGRVRFGTTQGILTQLIDDPSITTEHEIRVTGLSANTKYFYSVGSSTAVLAGNDQNHFFFTSPSLGQSNPYRIWILGDSGTADANAQAVRNAYLAYNGSTYTNLLLMLGDNAYETGTDSEYQSAVFDMYPGVLRQTPLWSTIGNHDTAQSTNPPGSLPYFQMFTLPVNAEAGGVASGTEKYYSFNYGNMHFICLDSMTSSRATNGAMLTWLQSDLAQNAQPWVIAFWHHPPYTKGSHNSDTESQLIEMRTNVLPILDSWGVDLVLSGHSHSYERSFLIDGHYGDSNTFTNSMKKNTGGGRENIDGVYTKSALIPNLPHEGAVYAVAGSSGKISGGALNHPAMFVSLNNLGSMVLDVFNGRLDAKFLRENGTIADNFTIIKGAASAQGTESDIAGRPGGDGVIRSDDVIQVQRFQIGLDQPYQLNEFQRADSAPFSSRGDGQIQSNDVVQAQRFQIGLDAQQSASGPLMSSFGSASLVNGPMSASRLGNDQTAHKNQTELLLPRELRVESNFTSNGQGQVVVNIRADAIGDESSHGFDLTYDPALFTNASVAIGTAGGSRFCNTAVAGQISCSVNNYPDNQPGSSTDQIGEIHAGNDQILARITLTLATDLPVGPSPITFTNANASNDAAQSLPVSSQNGAVTILGPTAANVAVSGRVRNASGNGIRNVSIRMVSANGETRTTISSAFGSYKFDNIPIGENYVLTVTSKKYSFRQPSIVRTITEDIIDLDFIADGD